MREIRAGKVNLGGENALVIIGGPCVIESEESAVRHALGIKKITSRLGFPFIFKASYDKANRTSIASFRGPGLHEGLRVLAAVKEAADVPVLSDVHSVAEVEEASRILDVIQIPAFLSRQTDLLLAAGRSQKAVNVKKGQFLSPEDMRMVVAKVEAGGNKNIMLTERGTSFGYRDLVSDFRSLVLMREFGYPVVYDAGHSVQKPGARGCSSGGDSRFILPLAKAAVAVGCDALFLEIHENPSAALSDGPNSLGINELEETLEEIKEVWKASHGHQKG